MINCVECGGEDFKIEYHKLNSSINGEIIEVMSECFLCQNCHSPLMNTEQMNLFRDAIKKKVNQDD